MKSFDYFCDSCDQKKTNEEMESFVCECGGQMRLDGGVNGVVFQPFYSREMRTYITSSRHEEKMLRKKGFAYLSDHPSIKNEAKQIRKHKNDHVKAQYESEGKHGWKPGLSWRDKGGGWERKTASVAIALLFIAMPAFAEIEGVAYADINVGNRSVHFPIGNKERQADVLILKKALRGDRDAREVFLGGEKEKWFYVGDERALWLRMTPYTEEIVDPFQGGSPAKEPGLVSRYDDKSTQR